jgi:diguanylate cyclase (GGDEF)-like protein/PAS domain S-box-containing protein
MQALFDGLPVGVALVDQKGTCHKVNAAFGMALRQRSENAIGKLWWQKAHPNDRDRLAKAWSDLLHNDTALHCEFSVERSDGSMGWLLAQAVRHPSSGEPPRPEYLVICTDVSHGKAEEREIQRLAFFDVLTGLPNRRLLMDRLKQALTLVNRSRQGGALLFLDLDNFKTLNDTYGHQKGDLLLQQVAARFKTCVREGDTVARLGGDEFVAVLEGLSASSTVSARQVRGIAEKILIALNQSYDLEGMEYLCSPSVGITLFERTGDSVDELMKRADMAMYQAKAAGRNTFRFFDPDMQAVITARIALENDLRLALQEEQFVLHFQPKVDTSGRITGAEAFVRWEHPERGMVSPAAFIPLAEDTGLIVPLGYMVLRAACLQLARWALNEKTSHLTMEVKVSAAQLRQADFVESVLSVVEVAQANPVLLKLELNESLLVVDIEDVIAKTTLLNARGVGITLADLGTGYSSLSHLKRLALDQLRIDQSFVRGLLTNPNDAAVTRSIFALAESMDLTVGAAGVETKEQRDVLAQHGCLEFQGYLFSQPLMAEEFEALLFRERAI